MIESLGKGLTVLICSDYKYNFNWMAYASWYSVSRVLPEARVAVAVARSKKIETYLYNWVYQCDVGYVTHRNIGEEKRLPYLNKLYGTHVALKKTVSPPLLVIDADMMAVNPLSEKTLGVLNSCDFATSSSPYGTPAGPVWFFNGGAAEKVERAINSLRLHRGDHLDLKSLGEGVVADELCVDAGVSEAATFAHVDRCGNYAKAGWEKGKTLPPFNITTALQTADMTAGEKKVLSLWRQMGPLFGVVNYAKKDQNEVPQIRQ